MKVTRVLKRTIKALKRFLLNIDYLKIIITTNIIVLFAILFITHIIGDITMDLQRQIMLHKQVWRQNIDELQMTIAKALDKTIENDERQLEMIKRIINTTKQLKIQQERILDELSKTSKIDLDDIENIKRANFFIYNATSVVGGSGSHIKIRQNYYILTAAHLIFNEDDVMWAIADNGKRYFLQLIKINRKEDLALLRIQGTENIPCLEISDEKPKGGSEIVVIGNPDHMTDIITDGIVAKITNKYYIFTNTIYFGNSGGAILYKGKIIGVASKMRTYFNKFAPTQASYASYGLGVKLETIQEFLEGIK